MCASLSSNTLKQYGVTYKLWWSFCSKNNYNVTETSIQVLLLFLVKQFNKGDSYGSLNSHRSAMSLLLGGNIGSDSQVTRLLKGAYKIRTPKSKYTHTWDPQIVLDTMSTWYPNNSLNLEKLSKKLVILLALCTAHRVQTLSLIKINNIIINNNDIQINIQDIIKTSRAGKDQPTIIIPYFRQNPNICPAKTLEDYCAMTNDLKPNNVNQLIITTRKPHKGATSQSIARWIKQTMGQCGIDVTTFGAHSTRHAATSAAAAQGLSIDVIQKTAGWTAASETFAKFYQRPIDSRHDFFRAVWERRKIFIFF